ncbi:hypothetical protein DPX16_0397 [Anabarilius grahami]|uniref:Uncharacterized protein n=1 Tax=Anabarilius grahami TaxID=495550 RepID=A0A3N0XHW3_ANAGA|nr:hypothetical protein DPX16_0397 [Anabarilius grahami]
MKEYTDRQRHAKSPKIPVGSFVRIRKPGIIKKGHSKFTPPLKVVAQKGPATYLLGDGRAWNAIHLAPTSPCVTTSDTSLMRNRHNYGSMEKTDQDDQSEDKTDQDDQSEDEL